MNTSHPMIIFFILDRNFNLNTIKVSKRDTFTREACISIISDLKKAWDGQPFFNRIALAL